jgi:uncharacterized protein (DUF1330 family)
MYGAEISKIDFFTASRQRLRHPPEYWAVAPLRERSAQTNAVVVEGVDDGKAL